MKFSVTVMGGWIRHGYLCGPPLIVAALGGVTPSHASDDSAYQPLHEITITATRSPEPIDQIPAPVSTVSGEELRQRDALDLASSLSLVPGVEAPGGGDAGPSSAVPSFWGLHEFDAFLLLVDGIPWGGAFNPAITSLEMNNVERIEVVKGAAPVTYGATSFVGVVNVLHYAAGEAANEANIGAGSYGSARGSTALALSPLGNYRHSLAVSGESLGFADRREAVADGKLLYRGALKLGEDQLRVDASLSVVRDVPPSPVIREGKGLTIRTPINANFNPADAAIDEAKYQLVLGYSRHIEWGVWETLVSFTHSHVSDVRAFLHPDLSGAADTQDQSRAIDDDYLDTHLTAELGNATLLAGADLLYGYGRQSTLNGNSAYTVPLDGSVLPPSTAAFPANEVGSLADSRLFAGEYGQVDWKPGERWDFTAGARLNEMHEHKISSDLSLPPYSPIEQHDAGDGSRDAVRMTETMGVSYRAWSQGRDEIVLYGDYRGAFKPAALDFGPDFQPAVLHPETATSYEAGVKAAALDGRIAYQAELFRMDFHNLVVPTESGALTNAAASQLKGAELEARYGVSHDVSIAANYAYHTAHFTRYFFFDQDAGSYADVAGRDLPLSPHHLASAGILYTPSQGFAWTVVAAYVGRRFLDEQNLAPTGGYVKLDATLGYRLGGYRISIEGTNLTNKRPPVTASEFGSESFYLLNARTLWLRLAYRKS